MLRLLTDLNVVNRFDVEVSGALAAGTDVGQGTWAVKNGDTLALPEAGAAGALQIFTESNRDGSDGWSPDANASHKNQLTVLLGSYRALTDKYAGAPSPGDKLGVNAEGNLAVIDDGTGDTLAATAAVVAVCTKGPHSVRHLQSDFEMVEFITV